MSLIFLTEDTHIPDPLCLCLGTFDGVHLGHQALIRTCVGRAKEKGLIPAAFVFVRPPALTLRANADPVLTEMTDKQLLLEKAGIERVLCTDFDARFSNYSYRDFFERFIVRQMNAKHVVVGFHYRFGRHAEGNASILAQLCETEGISIDVVPPVKTNSGLLISSTAIRRFIIQGNRRAAEEMLGRKLLPHEEKLLGGVSNE